MAKRSRRFFKKMELPEMYWQYWWKTYCDRGPRTQREFVFLIIRDFTALAVADANYNFMYLDVGCQGHILDGGVFHFT